MITKSVNSKPFKLMLMKFLPLQERSLFSIHDLTGVKLLARVRVKFIHLNEHKFRRNFKNTAVPMRDCRTETETTEYFFLRCPFFVAERQKLLNNVYNKHSSMQLIILNLIILKF